MINNEAENIEKSKNTFLDKSVDGIFRNYKVLLLILILVFGSVIRLFAALNIEPNADEMVHGPHAVGIIKSGVIGRVWQSILWSYLTDFFYNFLGKGMLGSRSLSLIFGSLSIIVVYLISKELFKDERSALVAAFLLAISSLTIVNILIEMDIAAIFFVLIASLFFIKRINKDNGFSYIAAAFIGIAALIKTLSFFFVPAFIIYYLYVNKKIDKKRIFETVKFILIILGMSSPILIHNYLWYQDKGMVDAYFSQYFDIKNSREAYAGIQGINQGFKFGEIISGSAHMLWYHLKFDPLNLILGVIGLIIFYKKKEKFALFFILFQLFAFYFITVTNRLPTHYSVLPPVFAIYGGHLLIFSIEKYLRKISFKNIFGILLIITIVSSLILFPYLGSQTAVTKMREYAISEIDKEAIVVADARIYRGRIMWMFIDRHYLESSLFPEIMNINANISTQDITEEIYFIECVIDDCGWGTINDQPDFNQSSEYLVDLFRQNSEEVALIYGGGSHVYYPSKPYFRVYKSNIQIKPELKAVIDSSHEFFFYPANYEPKERIFDNYEISGPLNNLLYLLAKVIIWAGFFVSILSLFLPFYLLYKKIIET